MLDDVRISIVPALTLGAFPVTVIYIATFVSGIEYLASHALTSRPVIVTLIIYLAGGTGLTGIWALGIYAIRRQGNLANVWKGWLFTLFVFVGVGLIVFVLPGTYPWRQL